MEKTKKEIFNQPNTSTFRELSGTSVLMVANKKSGKQKSATYEHIVSNRKV